MNEKVIVRGKKTRGTRSSTRNWPQICSDHVEEFPQIRQMQKGTFNVALEQGCNYRPPGDSKYEQMARDRGNSVNRYGDGNHISPRAKVVEVNDQPFEAWIYRGHNKLHVLELIAYKRISETFGISDGDKVLLTVEHFPEGTPGMPDYPPTLPGKTLSK